MIGQRSVIGGGEDYRVKLRTPAPSCTITMSHCHWTVFLKCWMFTFAELSLVIKSGIFTSAKSVIAFWAQDRHQAEVREVAKFIPITHVFYQMIQSRWRRVNADISSSISHHYTIRLVLSYRPSSIAFKLRGQSSQDSSSATSELTNCENSLPLS